jgi:phosphatidylinositol alpha-1,6-mannosyltransferase
MTDRRYLVLTPGIAGADGIAHVARLAVGALWPAGGAAGPPIDVVSMDDPGGEPEGARIGRPVGAAAGVSRAARLHQAPGTVLRAARAGADRLRFVALAVRAAARTSPTDVLCLHLHLSPLAGLLARRGARLVVFLHGVEAWRPLAPLERWAMRRAAIVMANSEHTARRFLEANPALPGRRIRVCHLGVALPGQPAPAGPADGARDGCEGEPSGDGAGRPGPGRRGPVTDVPPEGAGRPGGPGGFALIVGRLAADERYKGHDLLLDLWPRIDQEAPGARLVVAGDGDDRPRLEARASGLGDRVRFVGRVSSGRLAALYDESAFFAMPSTGEGFGVVFLEAMRAGKACIGGVGAAAEVIDDGVTGLVVDPADPESVLKAVVRLFREPGTRERMGRAGAARLASRFTEAHFRRRFRAILGPGDP